MFLFRTLINPLIAVWNYIKYTAHLEAYRGCKTYQGYDFSNDTPYL